MNTRNRWPDKVENHRVSALVMLMDMKPLQLELEEANRVGNRVKVAELNVKINEKRERAIFLLQECKRLTKPEVAQ